MRSVVPSALARAIRAAASSTVPGRIRTARRARAARAGARGTGRAPPRRAGGGEHLARVREPVGVERAADALERLEVPLGEHRGHRARLVDADPVLARERAARVDARGEDRVREPFARSYSPSTVASYRTSGWRLPSPAWKTLPTRSPCSSGELVDPPQDRRELRPRHDAVLDVVVGRHPAHRGERALAAAPEERALPGVARRPELERPRGAAELVDGEGVLLDLRGHPVELHEQHRVGTLRVARRVRRLGGLDREAVHDLHRRREDPGGDDARDGVARGVDAPEGGQLRHHELRLAHDPQRHLDHDPERPLRPDDHPEQVGAVVGVDRLAAEHEQLAVGQDDRRARDVVHGEPVLQAVRAAGVLGDVAADRAHLLARGVGGVEVAVRRDRAGDVEVRDTRLDDDALALEVDLEDPVQAASEITIPSATGSAPPGEARACAARDERDGVAAQSRTTACTSSDEPGSTTHAGWARHPVRPSHSYVASCSGSVITWSSPTAARRSATSCAASGT